jgi:hypothetical protein
MGSRNAKMADTTGEFATFNFKCSVRSRRRRNYGARISPDGTALMGEDGFVRNLLICPQLAVRKPT